jgi:hypothetical protein
LCVHAEDGYPYLLRRCVQNVTYHQVIVASPQGAEQFAAFVRAGMDPNEVAEKVMHGIKENQPYIFSHPEWRSALEEHYQRMLAAYPKA